jgi:hypothetical protein
MRAKPSSTLSVPDATSDPSRAATDQLASPSGSATPIAAPVSRSSRVLFRTPQSLDTCSKDPFGTTFSPPEAVSEMSSMPRAATDPVTRIARVAVSESAVKDPSISDQSPLISPNGTVSSPITSSAFASASSIVPWRTCAVRV